MSYREPMKVLADILAHEMSLDAKYVMLYNEREPIPATYKDIFIILSIISSRAIGSVNRVEDAEAGLTEVQGVTRNEMIQIDIMSENSSARIRRDESIMALNSIYAQQQCELYNLKIGRIPSQVNDVSILEGSSRLNRYAITINIQSAYNKTKDADYYDTFEETELRVER